MQLHYDRQGEPISDLQWCELHSDLAYLIVAQTWVRGWKISTVWLGIDHGFGDSARPIIFETMIFAPENERDTDSEMHLYTERHSTESEALIGHNRLVKVIRGLTVDQFPQDAEMPDGLAFLHGIYWKGE